MPPDHPDPASSVGGSGGPRNYFQDNSFFLLTVGPKNRTYCGHAGRSSPAETGNRNMISPTSRKIEYRALMDAFGQYVPRQNKRRALVIRFVDGKSGYICGAFTTLPSAQKRADELNRSAAALFGVPHPHTEELTCVLRNQKLSNMWRRSLWFASLPV